MKIITITRHGETDYNKNKVVQGSGIDAPINETGRKQAARFYKKFENEPFDKIYISHLQRTQQSIASFIEKGIPYEKMTALNEISWGSREGMPFSEDEHEYYLSVVNAWRKGETHECIEGGESPDEVAARQQEFIQVLKSRPEEKNVLVCMHGRAMRILMAQLLNYDLKFMDTFDHANLSYYQLEYNGSFFTMKTYNHNKHLIEILC